MSGAEDQKRKTYPPRTDVVSSTGTHAHAHTHLLLGKIVDIDAIRRLTFRRRSSHAVDLFTRFSDFRNARERVQRTKRKFIASQVVNAM